MVITDRVHRYPHDEVINLRSLILHLENLKALENGSQERLKKKNGRKSDFEMETQGVKGRSSVFSLIPHQPLTSPIDVMHQLFLGVCKDIFLYYYERLQKEKKRELDLIVSKIQAPKENHSKNTAVERYCNLQSERVQSVSLVFGAHCVP